MHPNFTSAPSPPEILPTPPPYLIFVSFHLGGTKSKFKGDAGWKVLLGWSKSIWVGGGAFNFFSHLAQKILPAQSQNHVDAHAPIWSMHDKNWRLTFLANRAGAYATYQIHSWRGFRWGSCPWKEDERDPQSLYRNNGKHLRSFLQYIKKQWEKLWGTKFVIFFSWICPFHFYMHVINKVPN